MQSGFAVDYLAAGDAVDGVAAEMKDLVSGADFVIEKAFGTETARELVKPVVVDVRSVVA